MIMVSFKIWSASVEFSLINGFNVAIKEGQKSKKNPSLAMLRYLKAKDAMGDPSYFSDYIKPIIYEDIIMFSIQSILSKSEFAKIKKSGVFKKDTVQREWLQAFLTVSVDVSFRKNLMNTEQYLLAKNALIELWGSAQFLEERLPQIYELYVTGAMLAMAPAEADHALLNTIRFMMYEGLEQKPAH